MRCFVMFVTAVCVLFLLKSFVLKFPLADTRKKLFKLGDLVFFVFVSFFKKKKNQLLIVVRHNEF